MKDISNHGEILKKLVRNKALYSEPSKEPYLSKYFREIMEDGNGRRLQLLKVKIFNITYLSVLL